MGFRPYYTGGHWVFTDDGWVWVSDYDWGWAPFHYGSWIEDPDYGWVWIPGYDWAPAWVTWGSCNGYYGWAPIGPRFSFGIYSHPPIAYWVFLEPRYLGSTVWHSHMVLATNNQIIINNYHVKNVQEIIVVNNVNKHGRHEFYSGPRREEVEKVAHTSIKPVRITEIDKPGKANINRNGLSVYRPQVSNEKNEAKPAKITPLENVKAERSGEQKINEQAHQRSNEKKSPDKQIPERNLQQRKQFSEPAPVQKKQEPAQHDKRTIEKSSQKNVQRPPATIHEKHLQQRQVRPSERGRPIERKPDIKIPK